VSQSFDVRIERIPRFDAVKLSEFLLSLSGWLVLGLLVAGGVVWQAPPRAVRYTLIVASTEHEFSSGCCRVTDPDLPDAEKRRSAAAALSGRFLCRSLAHQPLRCTAIGWDELVEHGGCGIRTEVAYLRPRGMNGVGSLSAVAGRKGDDSAFVSAYGLRDADQKMGLTLGALLGTFRGCHLKRGGTKKVTDAAASGCVHIVGK
jgi:hypothetical protein